jgi:ubiquitin carboxyl-terminal hydrolase 1
MIFEDDLYEDPTIQYLQSLRNSKLNQTVSGLTTLAYTVLAVTVVYQLLQYFECPVPPISELAWNIFVYLTPSSLLSALDKRSTGRKSRGDDKCGNLHSHGLKSEAIKRLLGWDTGVIMNKVHHAHNLPGIGKLLPRKPRIMNSNGPPGLGNWDNSCYQNSVLQGLASLPSLPNYLAGVAPSEGSFSTATALRTIITKLNDPSNKGLMFWTPAELKTMNSWQQQDAQEYFSNVLDEVEKEVARGLRAKQTDGGLACLSRQQEGTIGGYGQRKLKKAQSISQRFPRRSRAIGRIPAEVGPRLMRNPLEGLLAQRVGCLKCGYVEGFSLIPFNCLTVPLGKDWMYDIRACLDDYTALEPISGVECVKCTLLRNKIQLERLQSQTHDPIQGLNSSPRLTQALHASIQDRLSTLEKILKDNDFTDSTILNKCHIPANNRVSATKSRQAVIARAPKSLVIHVNRSVFDEATGVQCKNFADVKFPQQLDLTPWCLGSQTSRKTEEETVEKWSVDPSKSMLSSEFEEIAPSETDSKKWRSQQLYDLRAVITHYGRHENGHYICYRKHRVKTSTEPGIESNESWWRLSDDEVSMVSDNTVLEQGGVFMLFYEKSELAKDATILSSSKSPDPVSLDSSLRQAETTSEMRRMVVENCVRLEAMMANHISGVGMQTHFPVTDEEKNGPSIAKPSQDLSASSPAGSTSQQSRNVSSSDGLTRERLAPPEVELLEVSPENPSIEVPFASRENPQSIEPSPTEWPRDTLVSETTTPTTDANSKSLSFEHRSSRPDDPPKDSAKLNQHPPMRTASPRNSRGSVGRAGKAMTNVSAMVTAN